MFRRAVQAHPGRSVVAGVAVLAVLFAVFGATSRLDRRRIPEPRVLPGVLDRTAAVPVCGLPDLTPAAQPTSPSPTNVVRNGPGGFGVSSFTVANDQLYAVDSTTRLVRRFNLDGQPLGSVEVPARLSAPSIAVDPAGNVYVGMYPATLVKLTPTGATEWSKTVGIEITGVYALPSPSGFRVGVVSRGLTGSVLYDAAGAAAGTADVIGHTFSPGPQGGILATDGSYVRRYDGNGVQVSSFGGAGTTSETSPTGGPFHFYQQGGAIAAPDGTVYVADATRGIEAATADGYWHGVVPDEMLGYLTERSPLAIALDRLYFAAGGRFNGNQRISWISLSDMAALRSAPREPDPVLGFGAGVTTGVTGNYFRSGQTPAVKASFDPWWARLAPGLRLSYAVRSHREILAGTTVPRIELPLPTSAEGLSSVPLALPAARPGPYEVDVWLKAGDGSIKAATCMTYTVGAPDHRLDFASLPPGADYGGPAPARGVALADVLGTGSFRGSLDWSVLLPNPSGALNFAPYDAAFAAAAQQAASRGVSFHVQLGAGGPVEKALVQNGTWDDRVREIVSHFKGSVRAWEVWNEPNITFGPADAYVSQILRPASEAIRSADPGATVIGGSVVGLDLGYYNTIGSLGGYSLMDVVAIHPYTGHNRSWEEQGTPAAITKLKDVLANHRASQKPLWITESAWWADGPGNFLPQAAKAARAMVWSKALGIERWYYFMMEGGYGDYGFSYSLIESGARVDDYVKPGALSMMTAAGQVAGRPFTGWLDTGIPHVWAAAFGPRSGSSDTLVVTWTDDLALPARLSVNTSTTLGISDAFGATSQASATSAQPVPLDLSGLPTYVTVPAGTTLRIGPTEAFGANVAAASAGARASATSATPANPASAATDGAVDALDRGDLPGLPAWASAPGDGAPALTVTLAEPTSLNRVLVGTHSPGSVITGLRDYDVSVLEGGSWVTVGQIRNKFNARHHLVAFTPRMVAAIRVSVRAVNFGGIAGGARPWFWPNDPASLSDPLSAWHGPAVIYEIEAFVGSGTAPPTTTAPTTTAPTTTAPTTTAPTTTAPTTTAPTTTAPTTTSTLPGPTIPSVPTNLRVANLTAAGVGLSWTAASGATGYAVERSLDGRTFTRVASVTGTTHRGADMLRQATYHYRVRATNAAGHSSPSNTVQVRAQQK